MIMTKDEIKDKYQNEIASINNEISKRNERGENNRFLKGMRFAISLFISDIKKLN